MKHNEIELEDWKDFAKSFPLYEQLRNKTIGITGATGLLGSCMVHCLEELDRQHGLNLTIVCFGMAETFGCSLGYRIAAAGI